MENETITVESLWECKRLLEKFSSKQFGYVDEDAISEAFVKGVEKFSTWRGTTMANLSSWMISIFINHKLGEMRKLEYKNTIPEEELTFDTERSYSYSAPDVTSDVFLWERIEKHVANLSPITREVVLLDLVEGYNLLETARELNITEEEVKRRRLRGRMRLQYCLSRESLRTLDSPMKKMWRKSFEEHQERLKKYKVIKGVVKR